MTSKPRTTTIRTAILANVAIPLIAAVAISVGVAAFLLDEYKHSTVNREATQVAAKATDVIDTVGRAVRGVAASYMSNATLIAAVEHGDRAALERFAVGEFQTVRGIYANVAIFEITDGRGIVVMRGHNPSRAGDDKSRLPLIRAALGGTPAAGIDASPTTGQTAFQAIVPLRSGERVVGTLMVGARLDNATAATIKATTGVDVVLLAGDKIAGSALPDGVTFALPPEMQRRALAGERFVADMPLAGVEYSAAHVPLVGPTGQPAGSVLLLVSHETADAVTRSVTLRLAMAGLLILLCAGAAAIWFASRLSRPLRDISEATRRVADGDAASAIPHIGRTDEIGGIAQSVEVFRANSVALAEARAQREATLSKEAAAALTTAAVVADVRTVVNAAVKGDFSLRARTVDDPDLDQVVTGVNAVCAASDAFLDSLGMTVSAIANGDLTARMDAGFAGRFGSVAQSLTDAMVTLNQTLADVRATVNDTLEKSADIGQSAQELAQRTESQAASIEEMTASVEEFSGSIAHTAQSANELSKLANAAMGRAEAGNELASNAVKAMLDIEVSSSKVRDIVELIDTIAFQTNLLALNASVEAARAGEQGRGFAVVADEVRRLAQQSGEASKSIRALIETATTQVGEGAKLVRRAGEALDDILGQIRAVNTSVTDISSASREQATGIAEISRAIANLDQITQQNANASDQNARSSADLVDQARTLEHMVGAFVLEARPADKRRAA